MAIVWFLLEPPPQVNSNMAFHDLSEKNKQIKQRQKPSLWLILSTNINLILQLKGIAWIKTSFPRHKRHFFSQKHWPPWIFCYGLHHITSSHSHITSENWRLNAPFSSSLPSSSSLMTANIVWEAQQRQRQQKQLSLPAKTKLKPTSNSWLSCVSSSNF